MANLIGLTSIAIVFLVTLVLSMRWPGVSKILFGALFIRLIFLLIGEYVTPLPDSTADARTFEHIASKLSKSGFFNVLDQFKGPDPRFISWMYAILYSLLDRNILMVKCLGVLFGIGCVFLIWIIAINLWDHKTANKVGWTAALFPSLVLYSVITMREVYIVFFLLVALYGVLTWAKSDSFKSIILAVIGFTGATFFHGGMFVGAIVFLSIVGISSLKKFFRLIINNRISFKIFIFLLIVGVSGSFYLSNKISVPYLGSLKIQQIFKIFQIKQI